MERRASRAGADRAIRARVDVDDAGVDRPHRLVVDGEALRRLAAHVVQEPVRPSEQPAHHCLALVALEVEDEVLLALEGAPTAERVDAELVAGQRLDLDHARPEVRDQRGPQRRGQPRGEVEHQHAIERERGRSGCSAVRRGLGLRCWSRLGQHLGGVFAGPRRRGADGGRRLAEVGERPDLLRRAHQRILDLHDRVERAELREVHRLLRSYEAVARDVAVGEDLNPLVEALLEHPLEDEQAQFLAGFGLHREGGAGEAWLIVDVLQADGAHPVREQPCGHVCQLHPLAVPAAGDHVREVHRGAAARALDVGVGQPQFDLAGQRAVRVVAAEPLVEGRLDALAQSDSLARPERGDDALHCEVRGAVAAVGPRPVDGPIAQHPLPELQVVAAAGRDQALVRRQLGVGPGRAEAGDGAVDQPRMLAGEGLVRELGSGLPVETDVLDQHVRPERERPRVRAPSRVVEVEDDAALAAIPHDPRRQLAVRVAAGRLDLDDVRSVVGEQHRREAAGHALREINHAEVLQDGRHGSGSSLACLRPRC